MYEPIEICLLLEHCKLLVMRVKGEERGWRRGVGVGVGEGMGVGVIVGVGESESESESEGEGEGEEGG